MNCFTRARWRQTLVSLSATLLIAALVSACDSGFKETKSGSLNLDKTSLVFSPLIPGQSSTDLLLKITHAGERPVRISSIHLIEPNEEGDLVPVEGCDRITEEIATDVILQPDVLPGCTVIISERPAVPAEIDNQSTEQVLLTFRPLLDAPDPSRMKLVIESNATGMYEEVLDISVSTARPELSTERVIEFASTGENTKNHLVRNNSTADLRIDNIRIERNIEGSPAPVDPATGMTIDEFVWDSTCEVGGACVLNSNQNPFMSIQVTYRPSEFDDNGPDKATLFIEASTESGEALAPVEVLLTTEELANTLTINPNPMVFNPAPNQEGRLDVSFVNGGLSSLSVYQVSFEPEDGPFTLRGAQDSFSIQGGDAYSVVVFALPSEVRSGTMIVETDADNAEGGVIRVPMNVGGSESLGLLSSDTSALSFDGVSPTESLEQTVSLISNGSDTVNISAIRIDGDSEVFEVTSGGDISQIAAGESEEVTVRFTRPEAMPGAPLNTYAGALIIESDSLGGDVNVTLTASPIP